jgi:hypothetical protein
MLNDLVQGTAGTVLLYTSMLIYLALGMTTTQYALRQSLDAILVGEDAAFTWRRHVSGHGWLMASDWRAVKMMQLCVCPAPKACTASLVLCKSLIDLFVAAHITCKHCPASPARIP